MDLGEAGTAQPGEQVTLLINNAGSSTGASLLDGPMADIELEMNTHFFVPLLIAVLALRQARTA